MNIQDYIKSGVIESYVLGMASAKEIAETERLRDRHPEIKEAIERFERSLEQFAFDNTVAPPPQTKQNLVNVLKDEFSPVEMYAVNAAPVRSRGWIRYVAAASIILLVTSSALNIYLYNQVNDVNEKYVALQNDKTSLQASLNVSQARALDMYSNMQLMSDPTMMKVSMPGIKGRESSLATVFWNKKTKDVFLLANQLPQAPDDRQYQLWAIVDGKPVDAGMIGNCNGLCRLKNIPNAQGFAITLEKKGGSGVPTMDQMYVYGLVKEG